ncbi:major facilitator superfamily domain-containing protein [Phyllosticta citrichinensis]
MSNKDLESGTIEPIGEDEGKTEHQDPFVVDWEPNDPEKPLNWRDRDKWSIIGMISFMTFLPPLASSMFAPGVPDVMKEFGTTSNTMATFVVSVFVLGFACGPLVVGPLSEMYGRNPVYHATNVGFTVLNILCARADSMGALVAYRFFAGVTGVGLLLPAGLFIYGWSADKQVHWIVPMLGTAVASMGMIVVFICIQTYLVDTFTRYAASANAANTVLRCILGALLPLCGLDMYDAMGLGWGNTLLGFLALALAPVLWWFYGWGERVRTDKRFQKEW